MGGEFQGSCCTCQAGEAIRTTSSKRTFPGRKGEAELAMLGRLIRGDQGAALIALKIRWVSLPRVRRKHAKMVFEIKKEKGKLEEQLREDTESESFPS